ncbi:MULTISPECIES: hypothetical protein [Sphingobacterium]|jgi:hypothetical protein|uniref:Uncharacterized protein n=1 Tax=Sphingobacterium litopenaei TaxID=2763500 RepID=A0ABR7YEU5_9SPHI|nr:MULTISPECIES: hypothetical protein [Sphingobacterium]MBD1429835.1 hypothetical protein [Sphingobacterium litopenaei]NGM73730.1 hypothetical protein [Sphingobacterium sp. SGL-16]
MKQFLLCLIMLICSIFMYAVVTFLEESTFTPNALSTEEGNINNLGLYQQ